MAVLDNAIWFGGDGFAESGNTTLTENGNTTTVFASFTEDVWDASQGGNNVSDFGAFGVTTPITANYQFSNPVENLSFDIQHLNDDGGSTFDDSWTIHAYDENGDLIPAADVIAGISGLVDETIITNPDGSVTIQSAGTTANDVTLDLPGQVSQLDITFEPGPDGTQTGGSGISDLTFDIPANDTDGDGEPDATDIDRDGDGILDTDEGYSETTPTTITITFDGDQFTGVDNTEWELRDPDGNLIASDTTIGSGVEITNVNITDLGDYTFTINDDFGDGLAGGDPASYTIAVNGQVVVDSGPNPNFGTTITETFNVDTIINTRDTDGDGIADHLDLDSDNDGITDNVEAQTTAGYTAPTGTDSDGDGLDDAYEGSGLTPVDTDGDGIADFIDTDSDNDGIDDVDEAGHGITQAAIDASGDADFDGIADVVDDVDGYDANDADIDGSGDFTLADSDNDTAADGSGATPLVNDLDFRDAVASNFIVEGTTGNDLIDSSYTSDPEGDRIDNNDHSDGSNDDSVIAGDGNDTVVSGAGDDTIDGGSGDDSITGGVGADSITGGSGDDTIQVAQGDTVTGGDGDDFFTLTDLSEVGNDAISITGGEGDETGGDTLQLTSDISVADITFTNTDDNAGGLSGNFTMADGTLVTFSEIENIICFTPGARIQTPQGARAVETLRPGDLVITRDNGPQPIRWLGQRTVPGLGRFAPVTFDTGALDGLTRPLTVSPQHRLLFSGYRAELLFGTPEVLIAARHLVNDLNIRQTARAQITYLHLMFDRHEIIYADGTATESFHAGQTGVSAISDQSRDEMFAIFPELRADSGAHGDTARLCLKAHEARLLAPLITPDHRANVA
ncbi:Hint domain-containing protein [uncultured Roseovarius sp.]|uniref:Hint domain-containing protein n=1 Tax=uncultured Roseovarius sp. TaxID=293344 RepID=UPI00260852BA|nr:Hint domain-containing protein [uncultured Roseovarius sp.]